MKKKKSVQPVSQEKRHEKKVFFSLCNFIFLSISIWVREKRI